MTEQIIEANGIELCIETFGNAEDPAVLLIHGASASMLWWQEEFCERLAAGGRFVIRYDQRDTGRSTHWPAGKPEYAMSDLARDAVAILDVLRIDRAHVVGRSMGGGTALFLGLDHADRVASLTFVTTSTAAEHLPPPTDEFRTASATAGDDPVAAVLAYCGASPYADADAVRALVAADDARSKDMDATLENHFCMGFDAPRNGTWADLAKPALVIHGEWDPVFPLPHGEALRDAIPGAQLLVLDRTGHDVPPPTWDVVVPALLQHTA